VLLIQVRDAPYSGPRSGHPVRVRAHHRPLADRLPGQARHRSGRPDRPPSRARPMPTTPPAAPSIGPATLHRPRAHRACLSRVPGRLARTVLKGPQRSNALGLPDSEAQFKTLKYLHDFPASFGSLTEAREFSTLCSARPEYRGQGCQGYCCGRRPTGGSSPDRTAPGPRPW